ncbi:Protein disulfide-isomerase [Monocercomonoides exilis]|uniref:Protein disulfide-isomerase n=1 Tax=Monocercomonoides exilis TaxID=2049356 RepID=UPI00355A94A0|nr:Protein disulfide-isomerase [Monocercomonoides exilis]|eukprot:MONOS_1502.1-p1 / transcript=MONOS_1502.1 / gene=MONOS_1502 / organism=Monocercomonoides_exilis_PA203 / gene_product=Protein disulfide-isomerase / transcript_product=Protein disulfide-isomerase / location=Mono_scaffold00026:196103-198221(-) / protein_length=427 / sequence_SO=supercontig / SO=protein_coding / is_pseudo=false
MQFLAIILVLTFITSFSIFTYIGSNALFYSKKESSGQTTTIESSDVLQTDSVVGHQNIPQDEKELDKRDEIVPEHIEKHVTEEDKQPTTEITENIVEEKPHSYVIELNGEELDRIDHSDELWMVYFNNPLCGFCQANRPKYEAFARYMEGKNIIHVGALACSENRGVCKKYGIRSVPTILFILMIRLLFAIPLAFCQFGGLDSLGGFAPGGLGSMPGFGGANSAPFGGSSPFGSSGLGDFGGIGTNPLSGSNFGPQSIGSNPFEPVSFGQSPFGESGTKSPFGDNLLKATPFGDSSMMKDPFGNGPFGQKTNPFECQSSPFQSFPSPFSKKKEKECPKEQKEEPAKPQPQPKDSKPCEPEPPKPCPPPSSEAEPPKCKPSSPAPASREPCFESRKASLNRDCPVHKRRYAFVPSECREDTSPRYRG